MRRISVFDDLPDLALIELFSYLSSFDALWSFSRINYRLNTLLAERHFFRRINLSLAHSVQFDILFQLFTLENIESLAIDNEASPLQLVRWPRLPRLRTLRIKSLCNVNHLTTFLLCHADTLTHLIIESNQEDIMFGFSKYDILHPEPDWSDLIRFIFAYLPALHSLDMGTDCRCCIVRSWYLTSVMSSLKYLRVSLQYINDFVQIMLTEPLAKTLRQLHVTMRSDMSSYDSLIHSFPSMINLHTFTLAQDYLAEFHMPSSIIEELVSSHVMPNLRQMNLAIMTTVNELEQINQLLHFNDDRRVNVHFILIIHYCRKHIQLTDYIPRGSHFHPRQIVGATYVTTKQRQRDIYFFRNDPFRFGHKTYRHMWYTLPWTFKDFFRASQSDQCLTGVNVFTSIPIRNIYDRLQSVSLEMSDSVLPPPILSLPHIMSLDDIDTCCLSNCRRPISIHFPRIRHLILHSLNKFCPFPTTLRSIQLVLNWRRTGYVPFDWSSLCILKTLPLLKSLRVVVCETKRELDETTCQLIANTVITLSDFRFSFRKRSGIEPDDPKWFGQHELFIKKLARQIVLLSNNPKLRIFIEQGGCGLLVWL